MTDNFNQFNQQVVQYPISFTVCMAMCKFNKLFINRQIWVQICYNHQD